MAHYEAYIARYGDRDFNEMPFNEVDGLIFSQLAYVDYAGIVVLLKTLPGLADAAGAAIDAMKLTDMLGCISGNDAVAIVARGEQEAERLCHDLRQYCK